MRRSFLLLLPFLALTLIAGTIDLDRLFNYADQEIPAYITKDNTVANLITDEVATLGRVLFYDKQLSSNNAISCASCHHQEFAFSDTNTVSTGFEGGVTGRHSMRLINSRFADEGHFFWDERAFTLEDQTTQPIKDHIEMGFSGTNGQPGIDSLINKMSGIDHYPKLFRFAFGSEDITEDRIQLALAQFVRSIQSFDSKFDAGRSRAPNDAAPFPNFTPQENMGKQLFLAPPPAGAGCAGCHRPPEFDIDPNTRNNGVIGVAGDPDDVDITNTRAPTLRDVFNPSGELNGPLMHDGSMKTMEEVIEHYNAIVLHPLNFTLDPRLAGGPGQNGQRLNLTQTQKEALVAFMRTLSGSNVYTDEKWSDPFDENGELTLVGGGITGLFDQEQVQPRIYPNPVTDLLTVEGLTGSSRIQLVGMNGGIVMDNYFDGNSPVDVSSFPSGVYILLIFDGDDIHQQKLVIR